MRRWNTVRLSSSVTMLLTSWVQGYERPVLVMFPSSKQLDVLLASGGVEYAITELEKSASEGPTNENQKIVEYIFRNWGKTPPDYYIFDFRSSYEVPTMRPSVVATKLVDIAVQSGDAKLWVRAIGMCKFKDEIDLDRFGLNRIFAAWEKFQLEEIETAWVQFFKWLRGLKLLVLLGSIASWMVWGLQGPRLQSSKRLEARRRSRTVKRGRISGCPNTWIVLFPRSPSGPTFFRSWK